MQRILILSFFIAALTFNVIWYQQNDCPPLTRFIKISIQRISDNATATWTSIQDRLGTNDSSKLILSHPLEKIGGTEDCVLDEPLTIGIINTLTEADGDPFNGGNEHMQGYKIALEEINQTGGIAGCQVELWIIDDQQANNQVRPAVQTLVDSEKNIPIILGAYSSGATLIAAEEASQQRIPLIIPSASSDLVTELGYEWAFRINGTSSDYVQAAMDYTQSVTMTQSITETEQITVMDNTPILTVTQPIIEPEQITIAVIYENTVFGEGAAVAVTAEASKRGIGIVAYESYNFHDVEKSSETSEADESNEVAETDEPNEVAEADESNEVAETDGPNEVAENNISCNSVIGRTLIDTMIGKMIIDSIEGIKGSRFLSAIINVANNDDEDEDQGPGRSAEIAFEANLASILHARPTIIYLVSNKDTDAIKLLTITNDAIEQENGHDKQENDAYAPIKIANAGAFISPEFIEEAGEVALGVIVTSQWASDINWYSIDEAKELDLTTDPITFTNNFIDTYNTMPGMRSAQTYTTLLLAREVIKDAINNECDIEEIVQFRACVQAELNNIELDSALFGPINFDEKGQNNHPAILVEIIAGCKQNTLELVKTIYPRALASNEQTPCDTD